MKSYIKIFSIAFLVILLFALYSLYFVSSATDYSSIVLDDCFFILKDQPDLTVSYSFFLQFTVGFSGQIFTEIDINTSGGFYFINYVYSGGNVLAYDSSVGWTDAKYRCINIVYANSQDSVYPLNYYNLREWICDNSVYAALNGSNNAGLTDVRGLYYKFDSYIQPASYVDSSDSHYYLTESNYGCMSYDFQVYSIDLSYYYSGLNLYSNNFMYLQNGANTRSLFNGSSFVSSFPLRQFYFPSGTDLNDSVFITFLIESGAFYDYNNAVYNSSNLLPTYAGSVPGPSPSYTITYYVDGSLYGTLSDYEENYLDVEALATPTPATNYRFDGWYYYNTYTSQAQLNDTISGDITLYGRFVYSPPTYTISFDSNGGSLVTDITGLTCVPSQLPLSSRYGYSFTGWYTDAALQNAVLPGATLSSNITLYAGWTFIPGTDIYVDPANSLRGMFTGLTESLLTAWLTISSQIGFGGITLLSVTTTVFVVLLIFFVIKIIKG